MHDWFEICFCKNITLKVSEVIAKPTVGVFLAKTVGTDEGFDWSHELPLSMHELTVKTEKELEERKLDYSLFSHNEKKYWMSGPASLLNSQCETNHFGFISTNDEQQVALGLNSDAIDGKISFEVGSELFVEYGDSFFGEVNICCSLLCDHSTKSSSSSSCLTHILRTIGIQKIPVSIHLVHFFAC